MTDSLAFCNGWLPNRAGRRTWGRFWRRGGFVRWCFASDLNRLDDGIARFTQGLQSLR